MPANDRINLQVGYTVDQQSLNKVKSSLQDLQKIKLADFSGTDKELKEIQKTAKQVEIALTNAFNVNLNSLNISKFNQSLKGLSINDIYTQFSKLGAQGEAAFSQVARSVLTTNMQLKQAHSLVSQMGETMANTVKWGIASSVMNSFTSSVQQAFQYVKSLDSALTDIRIVTGDSAEQMQNFAVQANQAAQALGRSTMDYSKAALTFYQQGLDEQAVQARTQATLQAQNITGAGDEMADYLTAVWNGYKVANEEAELYVDKLAAVADSSASNMSQLAIAMSKVASTANAMGVDVDSLNAQIATIVATTRQAPESVGNALKTIYARINDIATGADGAEVSLGNYSEKMAQVGFSVLDANGNLRDTGDVIDQIGGKWQTLSREQQIYLARTMAGQRQYNNLIALFDNWSKYSDLVNVSMQSQGSLVQKNSIYMESLSAKMEQLGAAGERVKAALINEEDLKGIVELGTGLTNLLGNFIESIGGGQGALLAFGSIATQVFSGTIAKEINAAITNHQVYKENLNQIIEAEKKLAEEGDNYSQGISQEYVDDLKALQGVWKGLSDAEKQAQQNRANDMQSLRQQQHILQQNTNQAKEFYAAVTGRDIQTQSQDVIEIRLKKVKQSLSELQNAYEDVLDINIPQSSMEIINSEQIQKSKENLSSLALKVREIISITTNEDPDNNPLVKILDNIASKGTVNEEVLDNLLGKVEQLMNKTSRGIINSENFSANLSEYQKLDQQFQKIQKDFENINKAGQQALNVENAVKFVGAIGQVASGINNIVNLFKIWQNDSISAGEKILQTFSNLAFTVPMLVNAFKSINTFIIGENILSQKSLLLQMLKTKQKERQLALQEAMNGNKAAEIALDYIDEDIEKIKSGLSDLPGFFESLQAKAAEVFPKIASFISANAIAIGGVAAALATIYIAYKVWNADADAAKKAAEAAQEAKKSYDSVKESVNELKTSLNGYNDAVDNLNELTKGTQQWKNALTQVNNQVLDLLDKFPELAQYISTTEDGILQISKQGQEYIQEQYTNRANVSGLAYVNARRTSDQANNRSDITNLHRNIESNLPSELVTVSRGQVEAVINAVQVNGTSILENSKQLANVANISEAAAQTIISERDQIIKLSNEINANTQATNALSDAYHQDVIDTTHYKGNYGNEQEFGKLVQQALEKNEATLDQKYMNNGLPNVKAIVDRYNEIMGTNAKVGFNNKITDGENTLDFNAVKNAVMVQDALDNLGKTEEEVNQKIKKIETSFQNLSGAALQLSLDIDQTSTDALSAFDIQQLKTRINDESEFTDEEIENLFGKSRKALDQQLNGFASSLENRSADLRRSLTKTVKNAYDNLDSKELNYSAREAIVNYLNKGLVGAGKQGIDAVTDIFDQLNGDQINSFNDLANGLDYSTMTVDKLKQTFSEAGIQIQASDKSLQTFINSMKDVQVNAEQNYKNLHDIINKIDFGSILTQEEIDTLKAAGVQTEQWFSKLLDGTYKLREDADNFYQYVNEFSLQPFRKQVTNLQDSWNILNYHLPQGTSQVNVQNFAQPGSYARYGIEGNSLKELQSQLTALRLNNLLPPKEAADLQERISKAISDGIKFTDLQGINTITDAFKKNFEGENSPFKIENLLPQTEAQLNGVFSQMANSATSIEEVHQLLDQYNGLASAAGFAANAINRLNEEAKMQGLDTDQLQEYSNYLQQIASETDDLSNQLETNEEAAEEVAKSIMNVNDGIETLTENFETWNDILQNSSKSSQEYFEATQGVKGVLQDLLGLDAQNIDTAFATSAQTLALLGQVANGSDQAIDQLRANLLDQIAIEFNLKGTEAFDNIENRINELSVGQTIDIDTNVNDKAFIDSLNEMIEASGMTQEEVNELLAGMNVSATFVTEPQLQRVQVPEYTTQSTPEEWVPAQHSPQGDIIQPGVYKQKTTTYISGYKTVDGYVDAFAMSTDGGTPQVKSITKLPSGGASNYSPRNAGGNSKGSGGSKGKSGGSGSTKQPTQVKPVESSVKKSEVTPDFDPYEQVDKQYERQSDIVDDLQKKEKKLVNKDRLKNLQDQNKALKEQADIIQDKLDISNNKAVKNTAAWFADQIQTSFDNVKFDPDGQLSDRNALEQQAADSYNARADAQVAALKKAEDEYNSWLVNVYNKASAAQQENLKNEKERRQNSYKEIERQTKERLDTLKKEYDERLKLLDSYDKEWQMQQKLKDQLEDIKDQMYEIRIAASKIKVDLSIEAGEFERDWLDFEKKFIKKISGDDFLGSAKASVKDLMSYFNTRQIQSVADQIKTINNEIAIMSRGGTSSIYGTNMNQAKADLEEYMKQQMDDLQAIQDKVDEIRQNYLDALDDAKDKMDKQIDQYERVNDLINHNVRLTQLLYGDKAYDTMNKYYDLQKTNNEQELNSLRQQQLYWQNLMKNEDVGSDSYKVMQENLDDVTDKLNSKLEEMIQNLSDQWQNRVDGIIDKLNNAMTGGRGLDYLDEQWDYINNYDDQFLDPVESRMGIQEVQSLYQQAIDGLAGSPRQQQKINSLMEDQLKLLREKDHLTEYDIERAKASLEVEKARLALEEARDNKTKMRLRRDSQGNYTYQYVADEEKLNDLQSALADAQANLYNTDKQHYKQNLNNLYDAYKDYIKKMRQLTAAYNATQDEEERARIQARIDLLKDSTAKLMQGFTEDNQYLYTKYLTQSTLAGLGLDSSQFNADQMLEIVNQTVPQANSNIQDLANTIIKEGGILPATKEMIDEIANATLQYDADVKSILSDAGTSLNTVAEVVDAHGNALDKNIQDAQKVITSNQELIQSCQAQVVAMQKMLSYVDQLMDKVLNVNQIINNLRTAYNTDQALNGYSNITADKIPVTDFITDTTTGTNYTGNPKTDMASIKQQINQLMAQYEKFLQDMTIATFDTGGSTGTWGDAEGRLAFLHQKELVLNETDTANILKAVEAVRMITNALSNSAIEGLSSIIKDSLGLTNSLNTHDQLEQDVHIEANFPNVTQHTEIEQAFNNLVNMASMRASKYKD